MDEQCLQEEIAYREWSEAPHWYCVKILYCNNGKIESEIVSDEITKLPVIIQQLEKPLDSVFETAEGTIYYTFCRGYKEAETQMMLAKA